MATKKTDATQDATEVQVQTETPVLRITAKRDGFRRAGRAHPATPTDYPAGVFSDADLVSLKAEPMLVVADLSPAAPAA